MDNFDFDRVVYRKPYLYVSSLKSFNCIGLDSEAYKSGKPFLFSTSLGDCFNLNEIPKVFFSRRYRNKNFVVYNLKYESGALIYNLPSDKKRELWTTGKCKHNGYEYLYIPHKLLRIKRGKNCVSFWDIFPFYGTSLDKASRKYLDKHKIEMDTKKFSISYVNDNYEKIKKYCIQDAILAKELSDYLIKNLERFYIYTTNLYSPASISFEFFKKFSRIVTVWRFWKEERELLRYACESYRGGKFEVYARGIFKGYEYDIISAYPYEIANLVDISKCKIKYTPKYQKNAVYGFLRCIIDIKKPVFHTVSIKRNNVNIFPIGKFKATITKQEYDYLVSLGVKVDIIQAYWLIVDEIRYPYRKVIYYLYNVRLKEQKRNPMIANIAKLMMNSFYGKMVQALETPDGKILVGAGWNPIYGSIITANVRILMSKIQNELNKKCLAVHTDSVITTTKLPKKYIRNSLGGFKPVESGNGLIVMSGVYQIGKKIAMRGYVKNAEVDLFTFLKSMGKRSKCILVEEKPTSWIDAVFRNKLHLINKFEKVEKEFDLNSEVKRCWFGKTNAQKLLSSLEYSAPLVELQL